MIPKYIALAQTALLKQTFLKSTVYFAVSCLPNTLLLKFLLLFILHIQCCWVSAFLHGSSRLLQHPQLVSLPPPLPSSNIVLTEWQKQQIMFLLYLKPLNISHYTQNQIQTLHHCKALLDLASAISPNFISLYSRILYTSLITPNSFLPQITHSVSTICNTLFPTFLCTNSISSYSSIIESCVFQSIQQNVIQQFIVQLYFIFSYKVLCIILQTQLLPQ